MKFILVILVLLTTLIKNLYLEKIGYFFPTLMKNTAIPSNYTTGLLFSGKLMKFKCFSKCSTISTCAFVSFNSDTLSCSMFSWPGQGQGPDPYPFVRNNLYFRSVDGNIFRMKNY